MFSSLNIASDLWAALLAMSHFCFVFFFRLCRWWWSTDKLQYASHPISCIRRITNNSCEHRKQENDSRFTWLMGKARYLAIGRVFWVSDLLLSISKICSGDWSSRSPDDAISKQQTKENRGATRPEHVCLYFSLTTFASFVNSLDMWRCHGTWERVLGFSLISLGAFRFADLRRNAFKFLTRFLEFNVIQELFPVQQKSWWTFSADLSFRIQSNIPARRNFKPAKIFPRILNWKRFVSNNPWHCANSKVPRHRCWSCCD